MIQRQLHSMPVSVYYSFASEDRELLQELEKHLSLLRRQKVIVDWHSSSVLPGNETKQEALEHLKNAELILLLLSKDFITSDMCYEFELPLALQAQKEGRAHVVPIVVRPCDMQIPSLAALDYLPSNRKAITLWSDRDDAFTDIVLGIRKNLLELCGPADLFAQELSKIEGKHVILTMQQLTSRSRFLSLIYDTWIVGILQPSLSWGTMLMPGLELFPSALTQAWPNLLHAPQSQPLQKDIFRAYKDASGDLLILGEPGAGKTTLLLQLVSALLERAQHDEQQPMPVVFTLASWAIKRLSLQDWMLEELQKRYQVPFKLAKQWLEEGQILPLLDGLDEVIEEQRSACVIAINLYHQEYFTIPLVVCSRKKEYFEQDERLQLRRAVLVQPLDEQQMYDFLSKSGKNLVFLRQILQQDESLLKLVSCPLLFGICISVYEDSNTIKLDIEQSGEKRYKQLIKRYITRLLHTRDISSLYESKQVNDSMTFLAKQMKKNNQSAFYIEGLSMLWLSDVSLQRIYSIIIVLLFTLSGGLIGWLLCICISFIRDVKGVLDLIELVSVIGLGLAGGIMSLSNLAMPFVEAFNWSWKILRQEMFLIIICVLVGAFLGGVDTQWLLIGTFSGAIFGGVFGGVSGVLFSGLVETMPKSEQITRPNRPIWRSGRYSLFVIVICVCFGILFALLKSRMGLVLVFGFGFLGAMGLGGLAFIEHFVLRVLLKVSGQMPWDVPRFLDAAVDCGLMRKVGSGYMFMHALLLDYFAEQGEDVGQEADRDV